MGSSRPIGGFGYALGPRLLALATSAVRDLPLRELAHPALERLARSTGESAQLYVRDGDRRVCIDAAESESELRTIVEIGASLPLTKGSAGTVFLAWAADPTGRGSSTPPRSRSGSSGSSSPRGAEDGRTASRSARPASPPSARPSPGPTARCSRSSPSPDRPHASGSSARSATRPPSWRQPARSNAPSGLATRRRPRARRRPGPGRSRRACGGRPRPAAPRTPGTSSRAAPGSADR